MGPYDPIYRLRDAAKAIGKVAEDLASGDASCSRPMDVVNTLEQLRLLVAGVSEVLVQQAGVLPEITSDRDAPEAGRLIGEAAAAAAELGDRLRSVEAAVQNVR